MIYKALEVIQIFLACGRTEVFQEVLADLKMSSSKVFYNLYPIGKTYFDSSEFQPKKVFNLNGLCRYLVKPCLKELSQAFIIWGGDKWCEPLCQMDSTQLSCLIQQEIRRTTGYPSFRCQKNT